jgi:hypothetical protein
MVSGESHTECAPRSARMAARLGISRMRSFSAMMGATTTWDIRVLLSCVTAGFSPLTGLMKKREEVQNQRHASSPGGSIGPDFSTGFLRAGPNKTHSPQTPLTRGNVWERAVRPSVTHWYLRPSTSIPFFHNDFRHQHSGHLLCEHPSVSAHMDTADTVSARRLNAPDPGFS